MFRFTFGEPHLAQVRISPEQRNACTTFFWAKSRAFFTSLEVRGHVCGSRTTDWPYPNRVCGDEESSQLSPALGLDLYCELGSALPQFAEYSDFAYSGCRGFRGKKEKENRLLSELTNSNLLGCRCDQLDYRVRVARNLQHRCESSASKTVMWTFFVTWLHGHTSLSLGFTRGLWRSGAHDDGRRRHMQHKSKANIDVLKY